MRLENTVPSADYLQLSSVIAVCVTDKQEKNWIAASMDECGGTCLRARGHCMCGTNVGRHECACDPGHHFFASRCIRKL